MIHTTYKIISLTGSYEYGAISEYCIRNLHLRRIILRGFHGHGHMAVGFKTTCAYYH
jgi:hypothetical protein